jgi:hypothetical protein
VPGNITQRFRKEKTELQLSPEILCSAESKNLFLKAGVVLVTSGSKSD